MQFLHICNSSKSVSIIREKLISSPVGVYLRGDVAEAAIPIGKETCDVY